MFGFVKIEFLDKNLTSRIVCKVGGETDGENFSIVFTMGATDEINIICTTVCFTECFLSCSLLTLKHFYCQFLVQ